jgi:hypothetical protein
MNISLDSKKLSENLITSHGERHQESLEYAVHSVGHFQGSALS